MSDNFKDWAPFVATAAALGPQEPMKSLGTLEVVGYHARRDFERIHDPTPESPDRTSFVQGMVETYIIVRTPAGRFWKLHTPFGFMEEFAASIQKKDGE